MKKIVLNYLFIVTIIAIVIFFYFLKFTYTGQYFTYKTFDGNHLHLISGNRELFWFDVMHLNDANHPMFKRIENKFIDFNPDLILVEGGYNTFEGNRDEAIFAGESAFATYLAKQNGVQVEDIEPPLPEQIAYLQTKYNPEKILAMYHIRQITSIRFMPIDADFNFDSYLTIETQTLISNGLNVRSNSLNEILNIINSYLPQNIDAESFKYTNSKDLYKIYACENSALYPVYNDLVNFRNIYLIDLIRKKQDKYSKIFIVMGGQHLLDTKSQLKKIYSRKGT